MLTCSDCGTTPAHPTFVRRWVKLLDADRHLCMDCKDDYAIDYLGGDTP